MSASTTYLVRSLGTVYGVAVTSAIVQTTLSVRLPQVLGDIPDKQKVGAMRNNDTQKNIWVLTLCLAGG